jgi:hypothetical protein
MNSLEVRINDKFCWPSAFISKAATHLAVMTNILQIDIVSLVRRYTTTKVHSSTIKYRYFNSLYYILDL